MNIKNGFLTLGLFAVSLGVFAQKKPLDVAAYDLWRRIDGAQMSEDGRWVAYRLAYINGEGHEDDEPVTYLCDVLSGKTYELRNVETVYFFNHGKGLKYVVKPSPADTSGEAKDSVFLMRLRDMKRMYWNRPYDFRESGRSAKISYVYSIGKTESGKEARRLVIWDLEAGDSTVIDNVDNYFSPDDYRTIVYTQEENGRKSLYAGTVKGKQRLVYGDSRTQLEHFSLDRDGKTGVFTVMSDSSLREPDLVYRFTVASGESQLLLDANKINLPGDYKAVGRTCFPFHHGKYMFIGVESKVPVKRKPKVEPDTSFELELWSWNDTYAQSRQPYESERRYASPRYVYHFDTQECVEVVPGGMDEVLTPNCEDYDYLLFSNEEPYLRFSDWRDDRHADWYLSNLETGEKRLIYKDFKGRPVWSPNGKYALFYYAEKKTWYALDPARDTLFDISSAIGFPVYNEEHDLPKPADAYGIAGWMEGGDKVVLYDKYDLWVVDLTGGTPPNSLTGGWGREHNISLRRLNSNYEPMELDTKQDILLKALNRETLDEGIYALTPSRKIKKLMEGPYSVNVSQFSEDGKYCLFVRQSYTDFRDLWWSRSDFKNPIRLTDVNPQRADYNWGSVRLVEWTNYEGKRNRGLLYFPEDYDPVRRYPVIVNFYETHTQDLHGYPIPMLSSGMINVVTYVSNGYVVFMPDVHFTVGEPGESCYNAVVSGVQMLIDKGIADKDRIGLQGHSWSGYQVAYLVARTNMFRCASPGAAVSSMISAYTGIRTGSGMPRMFMYEETQSRMGKTLWEDPEMYIRNSPIFNADKIQTPLLIFHCDQDEAVPYSEGLNLFLAMRRLQKPAWLLNYKGERHFLYNRAAELDWTLRLRQFFDYYLKDEPMPRWMKEGISFRERGIDQKYDPVEE